MKYIIFQHHTTHTYTWYYTDGKYKSKWSSNINYAKVYDTFDEAAEIAKPFTYAQILEVELGPAKKQNRVLGYHI